MAWVSVRVSVRHTVALCQNGASYDHDIFAMGCHKVSSFSRQNFMPLGVRVPLEQRHQKEVPLKKSTLFCRYWLVYSENGCK